MYSVEDNLFRLNGKGYYTADYLEVNNIPKPVKIFGRKNREIVKTPASTVSYIVADKVSVVNTSHGVVSIYMYGEKNFFYSEEERDAYREEQKKIREEKKRRNNIINDIVDRLNDMTEQEIYQVLKSLDNWL